MTCPSCGVELVAVLEGPTWLGGIGAADQPAVATHWRCDCHSDVMDIRVQESPWVRWWMPAAEQMRLL